MRGLISAAVAALAVALQLAVADRMALPGAAGPSLVLVTVAALALARGPVTGMLAGFLAGLALDIAPPAGHLVGEDALVYCLVGYACGLVATSPGPDGSPDQEHSALFELAVTAIGAACGEVMLAALGVMLSDPRVTWSAVKHVLPWAIAYDVMLSPFVLFAVAAMLRLAGAPRPARASQHALGPARRARMASPAAAGAVRQLTGGKSPQLHLGGASLKATPKAALGTAPKLHFGGMQTRPAARRPAVFSAAPKVRFGGGGSGISHGSGRGGRRGGGQGRPATPRPAAFGAAPRLRFGTNIGASLLGGSVFTRSGYGTRSGQGTRSGYGNRSGQGARLGHTIRFGQGARLGQATRFGQGTRGSGLAKGRARIRRGALARGSAARSAALTRRPPAGAHAPRFRRPGVLSRLASVARRPARSRMPGRGWANGSGAVRKTLTSKGLVRRPGKGWIRASKPGSRPAALSTRRPARLRMRARRNGYGGRTGLGSARLASPRFRSQYAGWSLWRKGRRKRGLR